MPSVGAFPSEKSDSARTAGWRQGRSSHPAGQPLYPRTGSPGRIRCLDPGPEPASGRSVLDWNRAARRRSCLVDTTHVRHRLGDLAQGTCWCPRLEDQRVLPQDASAGPSQGWNRAVRCSGPGTRVVLTGRLEIRRLRPRGVASLCGELPSAEFAADNPGLDRHACPPLRTLAWTAKTAKQSPRSASRTRSRPRGW